MTTDDFETMPSGPRNLVVEQGRRIEELEAQVESLQAKVHLCTAYDQLEAENERLNNLLTKERDKCERLQVEVAGLKHRVERMGI